MNFRLKPAATLTASRVQSNIIRALQAQVDDCRTVATQARASNNTQVDAMYTTIADTLASLSDRILGA